MEGVKLGRVGKGVKCSVNNCDKEAARSISTDRVKSAGLGVGNSEKRSYLCKLHYKEFKKKTKKDKTLDKWRFSA